MPVISDSYKLPTPVPNIYLIPDYISPKEEEYLSRKIDEVGNSNSVVQPDGKLSIRLGGWQNVKSRRSMQWGGTLSGKGKLLPRKSPGFMDNEWPKVFKRLGELGVFESREQIENQVQTTNVLPNHCLVNEYLPGDGITAHEDGPAYFPCVATLSIDSHTVYDFYCYNQDYIPLSNKCSEFRREQEDLITRFEIEKSQELTSVFKRSIDNNYPQGRSIAPDPLFSIFVPRRSLIVISSTCYSDLLHSIPNRTFDDLYEHLEPCLNWSQMSTLGLEIFEDKLVRERRLSLTCRRVREVFKALERFGM